MKIACLLLAPLAIVLASSALGCGASSQNTTVDIARPDPAPLSHGTPSAVGATDPPPATTGGWKLFNDLHAPSGPPAPAFGSACETGKTNVAGFGDICGTKNHVAVEFDPQRTIFDGNVPCQLATFIEHPATKNGETVPPQMDMETHSACVTGDELVAAGTCVMCRIPTAGWSFHGRVSEMTAAQGATLVKKLALTADAPTTAQGWSTLIAARASKLAME